MKKKRCMLTQVDFESDDPDENVAPCVIEGIVHCIKKNSNTRKEVLSAALKDSECLKVVAQAVMSCKMADLGVSYPGTVAEFFCEAFDRDNKKKARKSHK